jgi:hypothetical protein
MQIPMMLPSGDRHSEQDSDIDPLVSQLREELNQVRAELQQKEKREAEQDLLAQQLQQQLQQKQEQGAQQNNCWQDRAAQWNSSSVSGGSQDQVIVGLQAQLAEAVRDKRSIEQQLWTTQQRLGSEEELRKEVEDLIKDNRRLRQQVVSHDLNLSAAAERITAAAQSSNANASEPSPAMRNVVRKMRRQKKGVRRKTKLGDDDAVPKQAAKRKEKDERASESQRQRDGITEARSRIAALEMQQRQSKATLESVQKANCELKSRLFTFSKQQGRNSRPQLQEAQRRINSLTGGNAPPLAAAQAAAAAEAAATDDGARR